MNAGGRRALACSLGMALLVAAAAAAATPRALGGVDGRPDAIVDLATAEGAALVGAAWRYADAWIVETDFRAPGPDLRPSGPAVRTHDLAPRAGAREFDDSGWPVVEPASLDARRGTGRLSFGWYRTAVTVPERIGAFDPTGSTVVFEIVVDDYAEVWVDGVLARRLGQRGGAMVAGFNAPNRVVLGRDVRPGQRFQIAVLGANGPLSDPPANFVWIRSATLDFHRSARPPALPADQVTVLRADPGLDAVVPADLTVEKVADGFLFLEGPVWVREGGYLLFSDPNANVIYAWSPDAGLSVWRVKSGYAGEDVAAYAQPGANGLTLDPDGRVTAAEHGRRRVTRTERNGVVTVLADRHDGRRLNSPNDLVYRSDGALYFTDPPFGLPGGHDDPRREVPWSGVYRVADGVVRLVATDLRGPNGLAFSPDERHLYVTNWDPARKVVMRYEVTADGGLTGGRALFDLTGAPGAEALDGIKVDQRGNLYVSGPGGLWIVSPAGRHLGTIRLPELPANMAWGDADGRTLYLAARTALYRVRLGVPGLRP